jgi:hypothetical protein
MLRPLRFIGLLGLLWLLASPAMATPTEAELTASVQSYFADLFDKLASAAGRHPTPDNFRDIMNPLIKDIDGLYGATLIDSDFVIRQVYFSRNFLARGYDLKKVKELDYFWKQMRIAPSPQLSEPRCCNRA